jgi:phosphoglycolate phosphatase
LKLIVFDCDGTLIDSQHLIVEAMGAAFAANGLPMPPRSRVLRHVGLSVSEAVAAISGSLEETVVANLAAAYRNAFSGLRQKPSFSEPMYPGARQAIEALGADADVTLGIATGKSRRGVDLFLAREELASLFTTIQTADDAPSKPHPEMLLRAMEETGSAPADTVMIGDTSYDILMACNAGVSAIGVDWGYHTAEELLEAGANAIARDFPHLMTLLGEGKAEAAA